MWYAVDFYHVDYPPLNGLWHEECGVRAGTGTYFDRYKNYALKELVDHVGNKKGYYAKRTIYYPEVNVLGQCEGDLGVDDCVHCVKTAVDFAQADCALLLMVMFIFRSVILVILFDVSDMLDVDGGDDMGGNAGGLMALLVAAAYNSWLLRDGFDNLIKEEWELLDSNLKCHEKFRRLKDKIKQWSNNIKTLERNRKTVALEEINSIEKRIDEGSAMPSDNDHRLILLQEIEKIDKIEKLLKDRLPLRKLSKKRLGLEEVVKLTGQDGLLFCVVKKYLGTIQKDLYDFVNLFFASCVMPNGANSSFFTLIPKVNNPTLITDFRPILLIGIHYKIIAKILANRLSKVIDKIVSKEQSAFIAGRQILDLAPYVKTSLDGGDIPLFQALLGILSMIGSSLGIA
ncbi:RNA-directed DNA polymerase, eukaryota, reverse transcriptase zinc-binding domain protein [Tanacetum coccineum]